VCCSVFVALHGVLCCAVVYFSVLQCVAMFCSVLCCSANMCFGVLQCGAVW